MKSPETFCCMLLVSAFLLSAEEDVSKRNLDLGWIGYLNLPAKNQKDGKKIKVKTPEMWEEWSENVNDKIDWFAKPKKDHQKKIHFYFLLDQAKKEKGHKTRRWKHLNK